MPARVILADAKMQKGGLVRVVAAKPLAERLAERKPIPAEGKYAPAAVPKVEEEQPLSATPEPLTETEENLTDLLEAAQEAKPMADAVETEADEKSEVLEVPNGVIIPELPESPNQEPGKSVAADPEDFVIKNGVLEK